MDQSEINRNYILALKKVKKEHWQYYRALKEDLNAHFGGAKAEERYTELKKLTSSNKIFEIEVIAKASGGLNAYSDIKQVKKIQSKLND